MQIMYLQRNGSSSAYKIIERDYQQVLTKQICQPEIRK